MTKTREFVEEIARRRVLETTGLYIVAAWVTIQVADLAIEAGFIGWTLHDVFVAAILGFPVALVFAWLYNVTRKGISRTPPRGSATDFDGSLGKQDVVLMVAMIAVWAVANILVYTPAPVDRSIAILPFENRGHDPQGADLSFGVRLDLQSQLAKLPDIRVIASTSADKVDASLTVPEVAQQLGAAFIMKGTVERVLDRIRVSVTLVDAKRNQQAWSGSWDRQLDLASLFDIRDEIAAGITSNLRTVLTTEDQRRLLRRPTESFAAHEAYLLGRQRMAKRSTAALSEAINYFEQAVDIDPNFVLAWVGLAESTYLHMLYSGLPGEEWFPKVEAATQKALDLNRLSGEAHAILAVLQEEYRGDDIAAETSFRRAIELSPSYATSYHWYGTFLSKRDREADALRLKSQALELDPLSANAHLAVGYSLQALGRFDEALAHFRKAIEIDPSVPGSYERVADIYRFVRGRIDEAVMWQLRAIEHDPGDLVAPMQLGFMYLDLGDADAAQHWLDRAAALAPPGHPARELLYEPLYLKRGNLEQSVEVGRKMLDLNPAQPYTLANRRNYELREGRVSEARKIYERGYPELFAEQPVVHQDNYHVAIDLALVLIQDNNQAQANFLLESCLDVIRTLPRLGTEGYGIADVLIYALQERQDEAIRALRESVAAGWRTYWWFYLELDPALNKIRGRPDFQALLEEIRTDMATQLAKVRELLETTDQGPAKSWSG